MALADNYAASLDPRVIGQVTAAIYGQLQNVESESSATNGHTSRLAFAKTIALGQQALQPLILSTVAFASLTAASTDTAVSNAVATLWNLWSGV